MRRIVALLALCVLADASCSSRNAPTARARRITTKKDLIGGPHALGDIGDYLLENDDARFIIQSEGFSRGFGVFGGSLIDADVVRPIAPGADDNGPQGHDNFAEMFPAFFLVAMEPAAPLGVPVMEILPGGDDGSAALLVRGFSNEFLKLTETINTAIVEPEFLRFETIYRLPPRGRTIEIVTTVFNDGNEPHSFKNRAFTGTVALDVPFGDVLLFGAGNNVFAPGDGGFDLRYRLEQRYTEPIDLPALPGLVTDFLASQGKDVSYGFFLGTDEQDKNFVMDHRDLYGDKAGAGKMLVPFFASAFTGVFHTQGPARLDPWSAENDVKFSFKRYFVVGDGDIASVAREVYRVRGTTVGEVGGRVLDALTSQPIAGTSVIALDAAGQPVNQATPRDGGRFTMTLVPGEYRLIVRSPGRDPTVPVPVTVAGNRLTPVDLAVDPAGTLSVVATDENGAFIPAKVTVVGRYPVAQIDVDSKTHLFNLSIGEGWRGTDMVDDGNDPGTRQYIEAIFITGDGVVSETVRPGTYDVYVSRGPEYDVHVEEVQIPPGGVASMTARVPRVVDTAGYLSADFHIHSVKSIDSALMPEPRVISYAAEGVEVMVSTDHNFVTDYRPVINRLGLEPWMQSFVGLELTTLEMGHFNGFPLRYDPTPATHGSFEWSLKTPDEIFDALRSMGEIAPDRTVVQVNHPRDTILGYLNQFEWDQESGIAYGQTDPVLGIDTERYPNFHRDSFSLNFDAMEIFNGKRFEYLHNYVVPNPLPPPPLPVDLPYTPGEVMRDGDGNIAFPGVVEDWFQLLRMGNRITGIANSDSHKVEYDEAGYPRTYVRASPDQPGSLTAADLVDGLRAMDAVMTNGPFLTVGVNDVGMGGLAGARSGTLRISGQVRTASWVRPDTLTIYVGGKRAKRITIPEDARVFDYAEELPATEDTFVVVEVSGGASMFPVVPTFDEPPLLINDAIRAIGGSLGFGADAYGNLKPRVTQPVTPFAMTNPVFVDVDGDGRWTPPGVGGLLTARSANPSRPPVGAPRMIPRAVAGPLTLQQALREPVRGQALDIRRIFESFDHKGHH